MILDAKNMELAGCYHQEPMSYDALLNWCRQQAAYFAPFICDVGAFLQQAHDSGKRIVLEAQLGAMRDIDYGIFPFTSSSNTLAAYAPLGAGIPNCKLDHVVGVLKAYSTCVGAGPFAAENAMGEAWNEKLRKAGGEYGAATGRPRRVGPFDCVASRYGLQCQGALRQWHGGSRSQQCNGQHKQFLRGSSLFPPLAAVVVVALCAYSAEELFKIRNSGKSADFPELPFHGRGVKASLQKYHTQKQGCCTRFCAAALFPIYKLSNTFFPVSGSGMPSSASIMAMRIYTPLCT